VRQKFNPRDHWNWSRSDEDGIYAFNVQATGISDGKLFGLFLRDADGVEIGGAHGWTWAKTCYVRILCVPAHMRNQGHGTRLMRAVEAEASPDHAPRLAFLSARLAHARRRSVRLDRCASTRCATHWGLRPKPHLTKTFKLSNDPQFIEKVQDIVGLYLDPPDKALVLCIDETSQIQALDRTQPGLPMKKGRAGTMTHDYKRHCTTTLFAALDVATRKVIGQCMNRHRHQEFLRFLRSIDARTPQSLDVVDPVIDEMAFQRIEIGPRPSPRPLELLMTT
jgi:GNAT superfamily N-acetyltransferase